MAKFKFHTDCVSSDGESINNMVDHDKQRDITRNTFLKYVCKEDLQQLEDNFGYSRHYKQGLIMANDWHVSYHKSFYRGKPCYYLCHSAIEYIFIK